MIIMSDYDYLLKYILVGNSGVGKSCILFRYIEGRFSDMIEPTLGVDFGTKLYEFDDMIIRL